jgi:CheY-like chemotaxis protein
MLTPLALALIVIEAMDAIFATDSVPAIFAVTADPFLVFTSNVFAILGLRSLYFVLSGLAQRFVYLKVSLAMILALVGAKMLAAPWLGHFFGPNVNLAMLGVVALVLACGAVASFAHRRRAECSMAQVECLRLGARSPVEARTELDAVALVNQEVGDPPGSDDERTAMRVLLVDSSEPSRFRIASELSRNGYSVDSAGDGEEGLRLALTGKYDAVVTEMTLAKIDGLQFVRCLRQEGDEVGVLFFSALCDVNERIEGLRAGADDCISKSATLDELLARVAAVIRRTRSVRSCPGASQS